MASSIEEKAQGEDESYNDDAFEDEYLDDEFEPSKKTDDKGKSVGKQEKANSIISKQSSGPKLGSIGSRGTLDS